MTTHTIISSPLGKLTLVKTDSRLSGVYLPRQAHRPPIGALGAADPGGFDIATAQLAAYFAGELTTFDFAVAPQGEAFAQRVWQVVAAIPYGETRSYGEIAAHLGDARLARDVGVAVGRNPLLIVIPCHRVIGKDGALTGYAGGLARKRFLLALENPARWDVVDAPVQLALTSTGSITATALAPA